MSYNDFFVILLASGIGSRAGLKNNKPKQFWIINKKPLLWYSLNTFKKFFSDSQIIVTYQKEYKKAYTDFFKKYNFNPIIVEGGIRRQDSVKNAFFTMANKKAYVLIHDSARPLVSQKTIENIVSGTKKYGACIPVVPVRDTIKKVEGSFVNLTLDRKNLYIVQTPQGFSTEILKKAYNELDFKNEYTDESTMIEKLGYKVHTISGDHYNLKITFPQDFNIIKALIKYYYEI